MQPTLLRAYVHEDHGKKLHVYAIMHIHMHVHAFAQLAFQQRQKQDKTSFFIHKASRQILTDVVKYFI